MADTNKPKVSCKFSKGVILLLRREYSEKKVIKILKNFPIELEALVDENNFLDFEDMMMFFEYIEKYFPKINF